MKLFNHTIQYGRISLLMLAEYMTRMAPQNLSREEARAILEYLRD